MSFNTSAGRAASHKNVQLDLHKLSRKISFTVERCFGWNEDGVLSEFSERFFQAAYFDQFQESKQPLRVSQFQQILSCLTTKNLIFLVR